MTTTRLRGLAGAEAARLMRAGSLARLLRPVRTHLIFCAVLSALGAAAGFAPYVAVAEIARVMLDDPNARRCGRGSASGRPARRCTS